MLVHPAHSYMIYGEELNTRVQGPTFVNPQTSKFVYNSIDLFEIALLTGKHGSFVFMSPIECALLQTLISPPKRACT